jgi:hypothetical protein
MSPSYIRKETIKKQKKQRGNSNRLLYDFDNLGQFLFLFL